VPVPAHLSSSQGLYRMRRSNLLLCATVAYLWRGAKRTAAAVYALLQSNP
jgi:hypothetical protein